MPNHPDRLKWAPYLSDRQWGTVREDYSPTGDAWNATTHDQARSKAWRWGEEGIGGISDDRQQLCFAPAFWNGQDPILKERFFGLTNGEGNHGEDVKELYYYLDSAPDHSYGSFPGLPPGTWLFIACPSCAWILILLKTSWKRCFPSDFNARTGKYRPTNGISTT